MIGINIDPIEMLIGKAGQHLMRLSCVLAHTGFGSRRRIEQGKVQVDEV
jgi:hypothetical protein